MCDKFANQSYILKTGYRLETSLLVTMLTSLSANYIGPVYGLYYTAGVDGAVDAWFIQTRRYTPSNGN